MKDGKKTLILGAVTGVVMIIVNALFNPPISAEFFEIIRWLSDCFAVPGILLTGAGFLIIISEGGFFDIFSYSMKKAAFGRTSSCEGYGEYKMKRRKKRPAMSQTLFVGLAFLSVSVILCFAYGMVS